MLIKRKEHNYYYITYMICMNSDSIYGDGVFESDGLPDIEKYLKDIKIFNSGNGIIFNKIVIISCIKVDKDFTND